ncbi:hypothetical protein [Jannaschia pohangensis]|uniref:hypothetical protein n=1 Tax=Jannaschia pohangensis TaxID=390807 RepID=UPI000B832DFA|nr:hypothetical protein [Jannaschia pohangensis]
MTQTVASFLFARGGILRAPTGLEQASGTIEVLVDDELDEGGITLTSTGLARGEVLIPGRFERLQ